MRILTKHYIDNPFLSHTIVPMAKCSVCGKEGEANKMESVLGQVVYAHKGRCANHFHQQTIKANS